jgi:hypothetical protein
MVVVVYNANAYQAEWCGRDGVCWQRARVCSRSLFISPAGGVLLDFVAGSAAAATVARHDHDTARRTRPVRRHFSGDRRRLTPRPVVFSDATGRHCAREFANTSARRERSDRPIAKRPGGVPGSLCQPTAAVTLSLCGVSFLCARASAATRAGIKSRPSLVRKIDNMRRSCRVECHLCICYYLLTYTHPLT